MNKLTINLLPTEILAKEKDHQKNLTVFRISLLILAVMITLTTSMLITRFIQNSQLSKANQELDSAQGRVSSLKINEGQIVYLKDRLNAISSLSSHDSKTVASYNLINSLIPDGVSVVSLQADKDGNMTLSADASDTSSMKLFFDHLTSQSLNQGKISSVKIDSLSRSGSGYRFDLTINII